MGGWSQAGRLCGAASPVRPRVEMVYDHDARAGDVTVRLHGASACVRGASCTLDTLLDLLEFLDAASMVVSRALGSILGDDQDRARCHHS